jgi:hypothetical protein
MIKTETALPVSAHSAPVQRNSQFSDFFNRITEAARRCLNLFANCRSSDAPQRTRPSPPNSPLAAPKILVDPQSTLLIEKELPPSLSKPSALSTIETGQGSISSSEVDQKGELPSNDVKEKGDTRQKGTKLKVISYEELIKQHNQSTSATTGTIQGSISSPAVNEPHGQSVKDVDSLTINGMLKRSSDEWEALELRNDFVGTVKRLDPKLLQYMEFRNIQTISELFNKAHKGPANSSDPFQHLTFLAKGGDGAVYKAQRQRPNEEYPVEMAIKKGLPGPVFNEYSVLFGMSMDVKGLMTLHPSYIDIFFARNQVLETDELAFVLPLCKGDASKTCQTIEEVDQLIKDVWPGLEHLQKMGICHRDIKPQNILLTQEGKYVISDFGGAAKKSKDRIEVAGTPEFMAPEVMQAYQTKERTISTDHSADVWSMAATVFQLLEQLDKPSVAREDLHASKHKWWEKQDCLKTLKGLKEKYKDTFAAQILSKGLDLDPKKRLTIEEGSKILKPD